MSRAERRRADRARQKAAKKNNSEPIGKPGEFINLQNPVGHMFEVFIVANAPHVERVVEQGTAKGQRLVICGAGPSLCDNAEEWCRDADQLWGVNSALPWLIDNGYAPTHGFTVDQTPAMVNEWETLPAVEYMLPSTVHPHLTEVLLRAGHPIRWFHNFVGIRKPDVVICGCGHDEDEHAGGGRCTHTDGHLACVCTAYKGYVMPYEQWLYASLYPRTCRAGTGLNSVNRAIDVSVYMGFEHIAVLGADCALRVTRPLREGIEKGTPEHLRWLQEDVVMHADGGHALASGATPTTLTGEIDGRVWTSKPDMMISAVFLEKTRQVLGDRITLVGDTLPNAIRGKPDEFLLRLPSLADADGKPIPVEHMASGLREWM